MGIFEVGSEVLIQWLTWFIFVFIFIFMVIFILCSSSKPNPEIVKKYGVPNAFFTNQKGYKTLAIRGQWLKVHFYDNFVIVTDGDKEYVLSKNFKDYKFYNSSFVSPVFGFIVDGSEVQVLLSKEQRRMLEDFFCIAKELDE